MNISILTNMVAPYRVPFFDALARQEGVTRLRVLTCVEREIDREWKVENRAGYAVRQLSGFTLNLKKGADARRIVHLRLGIFWELIRHRPDRLVIGDASWTSFLAVLSCLTLGIRYVVWNEITTTSKVSTGIVSRLRQRMYRHAQSCIASCQMAKTFLINNGVDEESISIVNNAVDNDFFLEKKRELEPSRVKIRKGLNIDEDTFCFIYVGQLISRKRVVETVELLSKVRQERKIHLLVAGSGPLESEMAKVAEENGFSDINFLGFTDPDRLCELYVASDGLILLSDDEPWGMVINEILLFGKPFFASESVAAAIELKNINSKSSVVDFDGISPEIIFDFLSNDDDKSYSVVSPSAMSKELLNSLK
ncbi:glycosyltransferase [Halomonas sp. MCCC 1A17488]|uniref:glycosyltransferase n=1 Tax=unclassified Halomonas TaxID=2609666 RepID=UPI0018D207AA|nr:MULTISPECIES: glycosyltransferase [unclassified Halomonas]MCE8014833.1 glycosyltransferase [Halomonas sp. MCCC 1A17488]MCG3238166.1 glycosyltransferase [Halomonas sp. MCCC 1A17488]QPP48066.1 glycosyltransferase [Halomonas sp. SS10-MC5]